jgi:hypothetical protein
MELDFFNTYLNYYFLGQKFWIIDEDNEIKHYYLISIEFNIDSLTYCLASNKFSLHKVKTSQVFNTREEAEAFMEKRASGNFIEA